MNEKFHWYCFTYIGNTINGNLSATACTYVGFKDKKITMSHINKQRKKLELVKMQY